MTLAGARPSVSLIVCTRDRAASLEATLCSIQVGEPGPHDELVVVDNGSGDATAEVIRAFAALSPIRVVSVLEPVPGLARARNRGVAAASREIVAFTDDDCRLAPGFFPSVARTLRPGGGVDYCGGRLLPATADDAAYGYMLDDEPALIPPHAFQRAGRIQGACMAFRRVVAEAVGPFDETFGAGTRWRCEDVDYLQRASRAGFVGAYSPDVAVYHAHGRRSAEEIGSLRRANAVARGAYYAKFALRGSRPHVSRLLRSLNIGRPSHRGEVRGAASYLAHRGRLRTSRLWRRSTPTRPQPQEERTP